MEQYVKTRNMLVVFVIIGLSLLLFDKYSNFEPPFFLRLIIAILILVVVVMMVRLKWFR